MEGAVDKKKYIWKEKKEKTKETGMKMDKERKRGKNKRKRGRGGNRMDGGIKAKGVNKIQGGIDEGTKKYKRKKKKLDKEM